MDYPRENPTLHLPLDVETRSFNGIGIRSRSVSDLTFSGLNIFSSNKKQKASYLNNQEPLFSLKEKLKLTDTTEIKEPARILTLQQPAVEYGFLLLHQLEQLITIYDHIALAAGWIVDVEQYRRRALDKLLSTPSS
ncbi:hypothetical protein T11_1576 [Trichinella zimbabwensis]|uniref:Uncharacterized protein n=1 Tax=Trichinella zimbabwensis TaxID=268475 RepID=A0A0V1I6J9_9BILA|nr:hypothetical protein T11_1576 [Trichinella zimbabwensis]